MANCLPKELNEQEQRIVNDIMQRSNLNLEDATTIARTMIEWGYTIHEQDYHRLKIALEIFERKHIHIYYLKRTKNVEEYNKMLDMFDEYDFFDYLIEEDYEHLKKGFGNET